MKKFGLVLMILIILILFNGCAGGTISNIVLELVRPIIDNVFGVSVQGEFVVNIKNVSGLEFYLGTSEGSVEQVALDIDMTTETATINLADLNLLKGTKYYYKVKANDANGKSRETAVLSFTTEYDEVSKDAVVESAFDEFASQTYVSSAEFNSDTKTGTITISNKEGKTAGDLWGVIHTILKENEDKGFPLIIEDVYDGLNGTYQYADSRLNPTLTYDIDIATFDSKVESGEFKRDNTSLLYKFIDSGARGLKIGSASGIVTLPMTLQGMLYNFVFKFYE